jgi:NitT/TauT family transport system substrate-binding protein
MTADAPSAAVQAALTPSKAGRYHGPNPVETVRIIGNRGDQRVRLQGTTAGDAAAPAAGLAAFAVRITLACAALCAAAAAGAQTRVDFVLNRGPSGDHAPYYFAKKRGWYVKEGIDLSFEPGRGSAQATQKVGAGASPIGVSDMGGVLVARGKGADLVAVFNVQANSPQGLYWLKRSGITSVRDLAGRRIGNPAGDGARTMWPALARSNGIDPASVTWVDVEAGSRVAALKAKSIDATTALFDAHPVFQRALGDDMGFIAWKDAGLNPYGNSVIVNADFLARNRPLVDRFVKVTQRAFAACVAQPEPCVQALVEANGALKFDIELTHWKLLETLMDDRHSRGVALGIHDDARMKADYELMAASVGFDKPFDVKRAYTNEFLDRNVRMVR